MLAKVLTRTVEASFHRGDTGGEDFGDLRMAAAFLNQGQERPVLRTNLGQRVAQGVKFLRIDGPGRLGNIFVLLAEG